MINSFFFKQYKRKKRVVKVCVDGSTETEEVVVDGAAPEDEEEAELARLLDKEAAEAEAQEQAAATTRAQDAADNVTIRSFRDVAIRDMAKSGVTISEAENKSALQLYPRVSSKLLNCCIFLILLAGLWIGEESP